MTSYRCVSTNAKSPNRTDQHQCRERPKKSLKIIQELTHEDIEEIDQLRWKKKQLLTPLKILVNVKPQKLHKMEKKKKIEQKKKS